jgi:hypothetical protein
MKCGQSDGRLMIDNGDSVEIFEHCCVASGLL